jgi:hypothetical protein
MPPLSADRHCHDHCVQHGEPNRKTRLATLMGIKRKILRSAFNRLRKESEQSARLLFIRIEGRRSGASLSRASGICQSDAFPHFQSSLLLKIGHISLFDPHQRGSWLILAF